MDIYYTLWVIIRYCSIYFVAQNFLASAMVSTSTWLVYSFDVLHALIFKIYVTVFFSPEFPFGSSLHLLFFGEIFCFFLVNCVFIPVETFLSGLFKNLCQIVLTCGYFDC